MKRIVAFSIVLLMLCSCSLNPAKEAGTSVQRYSADIYGFFDTSIVFTAYCESRESFEEIFKDVEDEFKEMDRLFDRYNTYPALNNIKTINDNAGKMPVEVDKRITQLLVFASQMYKSTNGAVNIMLGNVYDMWKNSRDNNLPPPETEKLQAAAENCGISHLIVNEERSTVFIDTPDVSIDVGAIAKGFAVDKVTQMLQKKKVKNFLINCGSSSIAAMGKPADKDGWNIGIRKPYNLSGSEQNEQELITSVLLSDLCVGTSGDYQNYYQYNGEIYHHLIDPETLFPAKKYRAVTVICESCAEADALSTAIFVSDEQYGNSLADMFEAKVIRVTEDMQITEYKGENKNAEL